MFPLPILIKLPDDSSLRQEKNTAFLSDNCNKYQEIVFSKNISYLLAGRDGKLKKKAPTPGGDKKNAKEQQVGRG